MYYPSREVRNPGSKKLFAQVEEPRFKPRWGWLQSLASPLLFY